jgi:branched-chain amino acid transport system permease protein
MIQSLRLWSVRLIVALLVYGALLAAQRLIASALNEYVAIILVLAGVNIILAVSLNLINGITGQFSLGDAASWRLAPIPPPRLRCSPGHDLSFKTG